MQERGGFETCNDFNELQVMQEVQESVISTPSAK